MRRILGFGSACFGAAGAVITAMPEYDPQQHRVMNTHMPQDFGCGHCLPDSAEAAAEATRGFEFVHRLIDESHYIVSIKRCPHCTQAYLSVFTETIDWIGGEDPQYRTLLPITADETLVLVAHGERVSDSTLNALGPQRRSLCIDYPRDGGKRMFWNTGMCIGPHD
jgi:hypothetical protein